MGLDPDDIVIISDVDEILRPEAFDLIRTIQEPYRLAMKLYYYFFNCQEVNRLWHMPAFCRYRDFDGADKLRLDRSIRGGITNSGWHFSYLMPAETIAEKLGAFAHREYDTDYFRNVDRIRHCMRNCLDLFERKDYKFSKVPLDAPKYVIDNIDRFKDFIL